MKAPTAEQPDIATVVKDNLNPIIAELGILLKKDYSSAVMATLAKQTLNLMTDIHASLTAEKFSTKLDTEEEIKATTISSYLLLKMQYIFDGLPRHRRELQAFLDEPVAKELAQSVGLSLEDYRKCPESLIVMVDKALTLIKPLSKIQSVYKPIMERIMRFYAANGHREKVDNLLMAGVDVNSQGQGTGKTALHQLDKLWASNSKAAESVLHTLCMQQANVNLRRQGDRTALQDFCDAGAVELIDGVLDFQPDATCVDSDGKTASALLQKRIDDKTSPAQKQILTKAKARIDSYVTYRQKFLASQEFRKTLLEIYSTETLYRIGFACALTELGNMVKNDIVSTFVELGLGVMQLCQDENNFTLSPYAAQYLFTCIKGRCNEETAKSAELHIEKCVEAHGESIMKFIFGEGGKKQKHLCNILSVALSEQIIDPQKEFPYEQKSATDERFRKLENPNTTIEEMKALIQTLLDKHLELGRPFKIKQLLNTRPHQNWLLMNKTQRLSFLENESAFRCAFVTQHCPELTKVFNDLPELCRLTYDEKSCGLTVATVLYTGQSFSQLNASLDLQDEKKQSVKPSQVNGNSAEAMKVLEAVQHTASQERFDTALALSRRVCQLDPNNDSGYAALAEAYEGLRRKMHMPTFEQAVESYEKALALSGPLSTYYLKLANLFMSRVHTFCGKDPSLAFHPMLNEALILCERANAVREVPYALKLMGDILCLQQKFEEAKRCYERCLEPVVGTGYLELDTLNDQQRQEVSQQLDSMADQQNDTSKQATL